MSRQGEDASTVPLYTQRCSVDDGATALIVSLWSPPWFYNASQ